MLLIKNNVTWECQMGQIALSVGKIPGSGTHLLMTHLELSLQWNEITVHANLVTKH